MNVEITPMTPVHWPGVRAIYEEGLATGNATFETAVPEWQEWDGEHLAEHRFVALEQGGVVGWTAVSPVSGRCVYGGVVENSVYVAAATRGRGVGTMLLRALVQSTEAAGIWTIETNIFPENDASLGLHRACGFRVVGRRERLGQLQGAWRDVLLMERRSPSVT